MPDDYYNGKWSSEICPDPKLLKEKLTIPLENLVTYVTIYYTNGSSRSPSLDEMKENIHDFDWDYGQCYLLAVVQADTKYIEVDFIQEGTVVFHSPGLRVEAEERIMLESGRVTYHTLNLEVFHDLDYLGQECGMLSQGNYDLCTTNESDKLVYSKVGCTSPFGFDLDNICRNITLSQKVANIMGELYSNDRKNLSCKYPCSYLKVKSLKPEYYRDFAESSKVEFFMPKKVRVLRSQYSFTGFSFVAEVGGYVGLFLGANFLQCSDLLRLLFGRYL